MVERVCPGLPASWLNAWLAAVGATVLAPQLRLAWSDDPTPLAVLHAPGTEDPIDLLVDAWPTSERLATMPIARSHPEASWELGLKVALDAWSERCELARRHSEHWVLSSAVTDLAQDDSGLLRNGEFNVPVPKGITLWERLASLVERLGDPREQLLGALDGTAERRNANGLGFDITRISSMGDKADKAVVAAVEVLAFYSFALFPVRGRGRQGASSGPFQRGWGRQDRRLSFGYISWRQALTRDGIDALLDVATQGRSEIGALLGITSVWKTVSYDAKGNEPTRAYGSVRVR